MALYEGEHVPEPGAAIANNTDGKVEIGRIDERVIRQLALEAEVHTHPGEAGKRGAACVESKNRSEGALE